MTYAIYSKSQEQDISLSVIEENAKEIFNNEAVRFFYENNGFLRAFEIYYKQDFDNDIFCLSIVKFQLYDAVKFDKRKKNSPKSFGSIFSTSSVNIPHNIVAELFPYLDTSQDISDDMLRDILSDVYPDHPQIVWRNRKLIIRLPDTRIEKINVPYIKSSGEGYDKDDFDILAPLNPLAVRYIMDYYISNNRTEQDVIEIVEKLIDIII